MFEDQYVELLPARTTMQVAIDIFGEGGAGGAGGAGGFAAAFSGALNLVEANQTAEAASVFGDATAANAAVTGDAAAGDAAADGGNGGAGGAGGAGITGG